MSIEAFREAQQAGPKHGTPSWYEMYVPQMTDSQREGLDEALRDKTISHSAIARVMTGWGFKVTANSIGHWRRQHVS